LDVARFRARRGDGELLRCRSTRGHLHNGLRHCCGLRRQFGEGSISVVTNLEVDLGDSFDSEPLAQGNQQSNINAVPSNEGDLFEVRSPPAVFAR